MAYTLHNATIASTYDRLFTRNSTVPSTGNTTTGIVAMNDSGVDIVLPLYISTERVGIGTATPDTQLEISKDGANATLSITAYDDGGDKLPAIYLRKADGTEADPDKVAGDNDLLGAIYFQGLDADSGGTFISGAAIAARMNGTVGDDVFPADLEFYTNDGGATATQRMVILENGNIGINTGTPRAKLHIKVDTSMSTADTTFTGDAIYIDNSGITAGDDVLGSAIVWGENAAVANRGAAITSVQTDSDSDVVGLAFYCSPPDHNNPLFEAMRVEGNHGRVGIGTTAPVQELHVKSQTSSAAYIQIDALDTSGSTSDAGVLLASNGTIKWFMTNDHSASDILDMVDASGDGVYLPQDQSGANWTDSSDLNLKTDISVLSDALSKVNQIRGVNYKWKKYKEGASNPNPDDITEDRWTEMRPKRDINRVGVIAQEIEEVLPEAVVKDKGDGNWGVQYTILIPLLIEAVKELSAKVTALENNNNQTGESNNGESNQGSDSPGDASGESSGQDSGGAEGDSDNSASASESVSGNGDQSSRGLGSGSSDDSEAGS